MTEIEMLTTHKPVELRAGSGNSRSIGGYAALFNTPSQDLGGFVERVAPTFFNTSQANGWPDVVARYEHDSNLLLGATRSNTLRLSVDGTGLNYVVDLPVSRQDVLELISRGDIGNSSFAFTVSADDWSYSDGGHPLRTLVDGHLKDVAPVSSPAYRQTSIGLRSLAAFKDVPVEDVIKLSAEQELRKLFIRTDLSPTEVKARLVAKASKPMSGAGAKVRLAGKAPKPPISPTVARMRTLSKKHPRVAA